MSNFKTSLTYLFLGIAFLFTVNCNGCLESEQVKTPDVCMDINAMKFPENYNKRQLYSLFFLDCTDKRIIGEETGNMIMNALDEFLITPGDKIDFYPITANTATQTSLPILSFTLKIDTLQKIIKYATMDSIRKCRIYACERLQALDLFKKELKVKIKTWLESGSDSSRYQNSDIAGLFYLADHELSKYGSGITKTLFIVSDLEQNCPGFFDLRSTSFSTERNIALGDANNDFQIISKQVNPNNFKNVMVRHLKGNVPERPEFSESQTKLLRYWKNLFALFGLSINTNL